MQAGREPSVEFKRPEWSCLPRSRGALQTRAAAKELHFNKGGETLKRMQAGVDKLASVSAPCGNPSADTLVAAASSFRAECDSCWGGQ